jgi:hypothetical protein
LIGCIPIDDECGGVLGEEALNQRIEGALLNPVVLIA